MQQPCLFELRSEANCFKPPGPGANNEIRKKNANNPAQLVHRPLLAI